MNIEQKIRNNREAFDDVKMPEGSRERFQARLSRREDFSTSLRYARNDRKMRFMTWTSIAAAAAITVFIMIAGLKMNVDDPVQTPQVAENQKLVEMRRVYDERVDEAIMNLENVMQNVDDTTRMQINAVIHDLLDMGDVFADMAPLPEERQMAITEQIYDNNLRTIELLTDRLNK